MSLPTHQIKSRNSVQEFLSLIDKLVDQVIPVPFMNQTGFEASNLPVAIWAWRLRMTCATETWNTSMTAWRGGSLWHNRYSKIGALTITNTISGVPFFYCGIMGTKNPIPKTLRPL